jgi:hypothetical protein
MQVGGGELSSTVLVISLGRYKAERLDSVLIIVASNIREIDVLKTAAPLFTPEE